MHKKSHKQFRFVVLSLLLLVLFSSAYSAERGTTTARVDGLRVDIVTDGSGSVPPLPEDNLISNPWFRQGTKPSLNGWTATSNGRGGWGATQKRGNPTPDDVVGTCARVSTGRGTRRAGWSVDPGVDAYLSQVVAADPQKRTLKFDMYWVTHTVNPAIVSVYGGSSPHGPWVKVWEPFHQVFTKTIVSSSGRGQDLWFYYSALTDMVTTTLAQGYPYYKVEIHANLPDSQGGFKVNGIYFAVE
ncbi:MAG TPA: hypothetical protein GXZ82_03580 [Firmicutes bacterium]|nr:hypothetical protein [Bacillota bacterium]